MIKKAPTVQFSTAELCLMEELEYSISFYNLQCSAKKALAQFGDSHLFKWFYLSQWND